MRKSPRTPSAFRGGLIVALTTLVIACTSAPTLHEAIDAHPDGEHKFQFELRPPTVDDLLDDIQCEIRTAQFLSQKAGDPSDQLDSKEQNLGERPDPRAVADRNDMQAYLHDKKFVVSATLSADVQDNDGLSPALSFITPLRQQMVAGNNVMRNFTASIGGQWSGTQHKLYTQTFTWDMHATASKKPLPSNCRDVTYLRGSLNINEVLNTGLRFYQSAYDDNLRADTKAYHLRPVGRLSDCHGLEKLPACPMPTFGATIDFTVVLGVNGGPTWTLARFKGPAGGGGGGSQSWLNFFSTRKNTLILSFASGDVAGGEKNATFLKLDQGSKDAERQQRRAAAVKAASDNNQYMLLQNLINGLH